MADRIPVIFDTDIGVDDAYALLLAAGSPSIQLLGITTCFGNSSVENCTENALRICELLGLRDVPVARGAEKALLRPKRDYEKSGLFTVHGKDGLGGMRVRLPDPRKKVEQEDAVELMARLVRESPSKVVLVPVGPLTNVALFLMTYPELKGKIDGIAMMGGSAFGGNAYPRGEANIVADPEAAQVVFLSGLRIVMCGLDATDKAYLTKDDREMFRIVGREIGEFYYDMVKEYAAFHESVGRPEGPAMHDSVPVAWLIDPSILELKPARVEIDLDGRYTLGCTVTDFVMRDRRPNAMVAMGIDRERFAELHTEAFKRFGRN